MNDDVVIYLRSPLGPPEPSDVPRVIPKPTDYPVDVDREHQLAAYLLGRVGFGCSGCPFVETHLSRIEFEWNDHFRAFIEPTQDNWIETAFLTAISEPKPNIPHDAFVRETARLVQWLQLKGWVTYVCCVFEEELGALVPLPDPGPA